MNLVKAVVIKRDTEDGVSFLLDEVPIGFEYEADIDTLTDYNWGDTNTGKVTRRPTVVIYGSATGQGSRIGPMPLELFRLEGLSVA
jgi:hypothetical protein